MLNNNVWVTKDKRHIKISDMQTEHIVSAFVSLCNREYNTFQKYNEEQALLDIEREILEARQAELNKLHATLNNFQRLKNSLENEAKSRGVKLIYPDQIQAVRKFGGYFEAERKTKTIEPQPVITTDDSH